MQNRRAWLPAFFCAVSWLRGRARQRQLSFLLLIHDVLKKHKDAQFIISSHSALLLGYPEAQIFSFDEEQIREIAYEDTASMHITRRFLNH